MQRTLFKYESTLNELDIVFKNNDREAVMYDLKKLCDAQMKEILILQRELDSLSKQGSHYQ